MTDLRYQPMPAHGSLPVSPGSSARNGPSMPQSCGKFRLRHEVSSKPEAEGVGPGSCSTDPSGMDPKRANFQSQSKLSRISANASVGNRSAATNRVFIGNAEHTQGIRNLGMMIYWAHLCEVGRCC